MHAYDELLLLHELGVDSFVLGEKPGRLRPRLDFLLNDRPDFISTEECQKAEGMFSKSHIIDASLAARFDATLVLSRNDWLIDFWETLRRKKVIFRLNGQSDEGTEIRLKPFAFRGVSMVGYSPHENRKMAGLPIDATIRLYKDPEEWRGWSGTEPSVMTSCQAIQRGDECCNPSAYRETLRGIPHALYGGDNEIFIEHALKSGLGMTDRSGFLDYVALKKKYQDHRVYFYVGTQPASYTLNFIEAWMTGIPVVSLGPRFNTHEVCELLKSGVDGFYSDDINELRSVIKKLLEEPAAGRTIGVSGRKRATELFGKAVVKEQWRQFLRLSL